MRKLTASILVALLLMASHTTWATDQAVAQEAHCASWQTQYSELVSHSNADRVITARHRGSFDESLPENSLPAFSKSFAECRPAIETDVRLTQDGVPVLFHDTRLGRVLEPEYDQETNQGPNRLLSDTTLTELKSKSLLRSDRHPSKETVPTVAEYLQLIAKENPSAISHLEVKEAAAIIPTARELYEFDKAHPEVKILQRVMLKISMNEYPTPQAWEEAVSYAGIPAGYLLMLKMDPGIAAAIDKQADIPDIEEFHFESNASRAIAQWASAPNTLVPAIEINLKDSSEFLHSSRSTTSNFGNFDAPTSTNLDNVKKKSLAEMVSVVHFFKKKLAAFVPVPDYLLFTEGPRAGFTVPNLFGDKKPIPATDAYSHNDSSCCYRLSDRRASSSYAAEKHDWRDNLDWQRSVGANLLTSDDTDTIEIYAKQNGYLNEVARSTVAPPPSNMNSSLYTRMRGFSVPDSEIVRIKGWNGGTSSAWGGQVCLWSDPGFYLWTIACQYENPAFNKDLEIRSLGEGHMQIRDPYSGQCVYSDPARDDIIRWHHDCDSDRARWTRTSDHRLVDTDGRQLNFQWDDRYAYGYPYAYNYLTKGDTSTWSVWKFESTRIANSSSESGEIDVDAGPLQPESGKRPGPQPGDDERHPVD